MLSVSLCNFRHLPNIVIILRMLHKVSDRYMNPSRCPASKKVSGVEGSVYCCLNLVHQAKTQLYEPGGYGAAVALGLSQIDFSGKIFS